MMVSWMPTSAAAAMTSSGIAFLQRRDVVLDAAAEQLDVLRQIAEMAVAAGRHPQPDVGAVEPHMAGGRQDRAGDQPAERRLARAGGADDPEDLARIDGKAQPADGRRVHPGGDIGRLLQRAPGRSAAAAGMAGLGFGTEAMIFLSRA